MNPKVKEAEKVAEEIKKKTFENYLRSTGITKFTKRLKVFEKFNYSSIYVTDKICMVTLREMLDMKMLSDFLSNLFNKASETEMRQFTLIWFGSSKIVENTKFRPSVETKESETNQATDSRSTETLNQFVRIRGDNQIPQDHVSSIDNRSQLSDFSLKFSRPRKMSENFFGF